MKRHNLLVPLSQEHHHTLALCLRLLRTPEQDSRAEIEPYLPTLLAHFVEEEQQFAPLWEKIDRPELKKQFEDDHAILRAMAGAPHYGEALWNKQFAEALRAHVRFEERELFPAAQPFL
ncbi:MAG: hemerythrin domain-containing protein, partial [Neisseria sp.]|nr:hemerythrin domain-containing protein [Neisseria sp.]